MTSLDSPHYTTIKRIIVKYEGGMYYIKEDNVRLYYSDHFFQCSLLDGNLSSSVESVYLCPGGLDAKAISFVIVADKRVHPHSIIFDLKMSCNEKQQ